MKTFSAAVPYDGDDGRLSRCPCFIEQWGLREQHPRVEPLPAPSKLLLPNMPLAIVWLELVLYVMHDMVTCMVVGDQAWQATLRPEVEQTSSWDGRRNPGMFAVR